MSSLSVRFEPLQSAGRGSRQFLSVIWAFARMGIRSTLSYPLAFVLAQVTTVVQLVGFLFLGRVTKDLAIIGSSYLTFATIGMMASLLSAAGVTGLGLELDYTIQQGRLEMFLIEPIRWRIIPVALAAWPILYRVAGVLLMFFVSWGLGANFTFHELPVVVALSVLGVASGLAIGIAAGAVRVLAKRGDPIATAYALASSVLTGQFVPLNVYPAPLRAIAWVFPNTYLISGLRKALMPDAASIYGPSPVSSLLILSLVCAVLLPASLWIFGRSLETGRRYGVLAGY